MHCRHSQVSKNVLKIEIHKAQFLFGLFANAAGVMWTDMFAY
jgi:hypothetical protein